MTDAIDPAILQNCVVHILRYGFPLCEFTNQVPARWPAGHLWVRMDERGDCNCAKCLERAA